MQGNEYTLPNGLRIIHEPTLSKVAYCGFAIDAGTRDEAENEQGMAHFVEHLIFKGTEKRKAWHILNRMENVGGDLNAYTNKEETVVYAAFLKEHLERALELLGDIVFHSTFPQHEIEKVENAERVLSRVEIAEKVWNTHFDTGTNFIDVYINYLRKKIDRDFEPKLIHTKAGMGFILTDKL